MPRQRDFAARAAGWWKTAPLQSEQVSHLGLYSMFPNQHDPGVLTLAEAARELRCSKAHVSNIVNGKVPHLPPLPILRIGRRVLIRHTALMQWMQDAEQPANDNFRSTKPRFVA
jgi:excisionase family DNA binding protein